MKAGKKQSPRLRGPRRGGSKIGVGQQLSDGPAYKGQQKVTLKIPGTPTLLTTTVTTGVIASAIPVSTGSTIGFSTRFGSTFDEYRILACDWVVRPVAASTGVSVMFIDEKSSSVPTANEATERIGERIPNTNGANNSKVLRWVARDLIDLQYTAIGTAAPAAYLKVYTDSFTWGAPVVATALWIIEPMFTIEFRGLKSS
jgi:hypothetical protein